MNFGATIVPKIVMILLLCALVGASFTPVSVAACFSDLSNHWSRNAATRLSDKGIISAAPDGRFNPDQQISRGDFARWLELILETDRKELDSDENNDPDKVKLAAGGLNFIRLTAKYFDVEQDGASSPESPVLRAQALAALGRALGAREPDEASIEAQLARYPDGYQVPDWDKSSVAALCAARVFVLPPGQDSIKPGGLLTRGEAAVLLDRFDSYCIRETITAAANAAKSFCPDPGAAVTDGSSNEELIDLYGDSVVCGQLIVRDVYAIFPVGTSFRVTLNDGLDSAKDKRGDYRMGTTVTRICINGASVEEGAVFKGRLTSVVSAKRFFGAPGRIGIHFNELEIPSLGKTFPVSARVDTSRTRLTGGDEGQRAHRLAHNAAKGAVIGLLVGSLLGPAVGTYIGDGRWASMLSNVTTQAACTGMGAVIGAGVTKGAELKIPPGVTMDLVLDKPLRIPVNNLPPKELLAYHQW